MGHVIGYNTNINRVVGCSLDIDPTVIKEEFNSNLYRRFWNVEPDEEVLTWNLDKSIDEFVIEGYEGDLDELRRVLYVDNKYVLYNRVSDDGRLYFVREDVLVEMLDSLRLDDMDLDSHDCSVYESMNYDAMIGLEQLLNDPLGFEWEWHDFRRSKTIL